MKFFIDTADVAEIRDLAATGLVDGITTNPSLVAKSGRDFFEVLVESFVYLHKLFAKCRLVDKGKSSFDLGLQIRSQAPDFFRVFLPSGIGELSGMNLQSKE